MASIILQETLAEAKLDAILSARIARARWSLEELRDLYRQTSREDYVQFRMMIARRILEEVKTVQCNSPSPTPEFLEAVFQVGSRLSDAGQYAEALGYLQEAVDAARTLSSVDHVKYIAPLASGLAGLSDALAGLGRSEEALGAQHEAVNLARGIDDGGKVKSEAFARHVNNLGIRFGAVGRQEESMLALQESLDIRRARAAQDSSKSKLWPLANCLNSIGVRLAASGQVSDSIEAYREAVAIYESLLASDPLLVSERLGMAQNNLSGALSDAGLHEEALLWSERSVGLRRVLVDMNPGGHRKGSDLLE